MSDLIKKNGNAPVEWNPLRAMRDLLRWDPFREMAPFAVPELEAATFAPSFEVVETKDAFLFKADVPGIKQEDIEITATGNRLRIAGKREQEHESKHDTIYTYERQYGSFSRSFTLPDGADFEHAKSELKDGVLTLAVPKTSGAQTKKIAISTGHKS
ncbi:MAG TPA: Hsp20/alpha crystallin family protein [Kofleriaceae bacterium]|nr:Hsp20/alpha crystallin family protein [Kofleriaceae bacterium]